MVDRSHIFSDITVDDHIRDSHSMDMPMFYSKRQFITSFMSSALFSSTLYGKVKAFDAFSNNTQSIKSVRNRYRNIISISALGSWGTEDDTTLFQKVMSDHDALFIPHGITINIKSDIFLPDGHMLIGEGSGSRIIMECNSRPNNIKLHISNNSSIENIYFEESKTIFRSGLYGTIFGDGVNNCTMKNIEVSKSSSTGIMLINCSNIFIDSCYVHNSMADGIHAQRGSHGIRVRKCKIERSGDDGIAFVSHGFDKYGSVYDCTATNCAVTGVEKTGSGVAVIGARNVTVTGCQIDGTPMSGIRISSAGFGVEGSTIAEDITVTGNTISNAGTGRSINNNGGIFIEGCQNVVVRGNHIISPRSWGIATSNVVKNIDIANNIIERPGDVGLFISTARGDAEYEKMWRNTASTAGNRSGPITIAENTIVDAVAAGVHIAGEKGYPAKEILVQKNIVQSLRPAPGRLKLEAIRIDAAGGTVTLRGNQNRVLQ